MSILVLALNPSIDAEWRVQSVRWEEKNTVLGQRRWAGGKGVNVARWLRHLHSYSRLLLPLGSDTGAELKSCLSKEHLRAEVIPISEPTRVNVIVTDEAGRQLRFNPLGPNLTLNSWEKILQRARSNLAPGDTVVLSGSLPRGARAAAYGELIRLAHTAGSKALLDCDGDALRFGVSARPFLVKPNEHELEQWAGCRLNCQAALLRAASAMAKATRGSVLVSRGKRGAVLVNQVERFAWKASAPVVNVVNTVGAGDAMLAAAAVMIQRDLPPVEWLRQAVAAGSAATQCPAGGLPKQGLVNRLAQEVRISKLRCLS